MQRRTHSTFQSGAVSICARFVFVGAIAACAWGCAATRPPEPVESASEDWSFKGSKGNKITSDHYVLYTTCDSRPLLKVMPAFLETCWDAYAELVPCEGAPPQPLKCYLFKARWQWERFTEEFAPWRADTYKRIRSGGYSERGITVSHYGHRRGTMSVLAHEGLHQYLEVMRGGKIPAWINEGLATRFEAFALDAWSRPVFQPERNYLRIGHLREVVTAGRLTPLQELLTTNAGIEIRKQSAHVRSYYAQVWSLVLFLLQPSDVNPYHDEFRKLLRDLGSEAMTRNVRAYQASDTDGAVSQGEALFCAYITNDFGEFQANYEAFLHKLLGLK
jgi:hypothetical protein